jgi:hypothetical protein
MALLFAEDYSHLSDGTTVTGANTAWDGLESGGQDATVQSAGPPAAGTKYARAVLTGYWRPRVNLGSHTRQRFDLYARISAYPGTTCQVWLFRNPSDTTQGDLRITTAGALQFRAANVTQRGITADGAIPIGEWFRIAVDVNSNNASASVVRLFTGSDLHNPHDQPTHNLTISTGWSWPDAFGIVHTGTINNNTWTYDLGSVRIDNADQPGPLVVASDEVPPTVPTGLALRSITDESATIEWDPSTDDTDDPGDLRYRTHLDSTPGTVGSAGVTSAVIDSLTPDTEYELAVSALDTSDNESDPSAPITIRTPLEAPAGDGELVGVWDGTDWLT